MRTIGIAVADRGAALVTVEEPDHIVPPIPRDLYDMVEVEQPRRDLLVTGIERLPFDLGAVDRRVRELEADRYIVDAEGLGRALWAALGNQDTGRPGQLGSSLYAGRGLERQALVDELLVAIHEGRFHFAAGLAEQDAMSRALVGYRRQVGEDGVIGGELVVALLLAIIPMPPPLVPFVFWV